MRKSVTAIALACMLAASAGACSAAPEPGAPSGPAAESGNQTSVPTSTAGASTSQPGAPAGGGDVESHPDADETGGFRITSPAFAGGAQIPTRYTCDGEGVSPPVQWNAVPDGTQSLALVVVDPDAPAPGGFTHWVVAGLDPPGGGVGEATTEGVPGRNDAGSTGWTGPCPPSGTHTYVFTLYAFDHATDFGGDPTRSAVESEPGVKATATLTGRYR